MIKGLTTELLRASVIVKDCTAKNVFGELIRGTKTTLNNIIGKLLNKTDPITYEVVFKAFFSLRNFALAE